MDSVRSSVQRAMTLQLRIAECQRILDYAHQYADERWLDGLQSFMDLNKYAEGPHIVNTSTALAVIAKCSSTFNRKKLNAYKGIQLDEVCRFYVGRYENGNWSSRNTLGWSPYVTALALRAIGHCIMANSKEETLAQVATTQKALPEILSKEVHKLQDYLDKWSRQDLDREKLGDYDHTFFAYTALSASEVIFTAIDSEKGFVQKEDLDRRETIKQGVLNRLRLDFYSHMTFKLAGVTQHLDVVSLALSMYCLAEYSKERPQIPDDVLDAALNTVFSLQLPSGFWDTSTPLLGTATGRVGCSSIELANCMIRIPRTTRNFEQYFDNFDRLLNQLSRGFDFTNPDRGWPTDVRRNGDSYQTWYSFLIFEYLSLLSEMTGQHAADVLLQSFNYRKGKPKLTWEGIGDYQDFKLRVERELIEPRLNTSETEPQYSMILFGPPGTGKTSIGQALAYKLGWGFVEIGPGDFLENGIDGIFAQGDLIFQRLLLLDRVVVLFDEIDELVSIRSEGADKLSKFLTTYMLPWLQRLRDRAAIIFIFATNHIERFDPAIRRHGRFDLILPIGPPQKAERKRILTSMKGRLGIDEKDIDSILDRIPSQATIGDIFSAIARTKGPGGFDANACVEQLKPERLLIKEEEWQEFGDDEKRYLA